MHDDLPVVRQYALEECLRDLQLPCRWTKELGNGYGYPLMNFYPPLPYVFGLVPRAMGLSYLDTVKLLFILSLVVSAGFMARLGNIFLGKWGGILAAVFYLYSPYHALDLYVRGDLNELWAIAIFPATLWFGYRLVKHPNLKNAIKLGLTEALIILSHVGMTLIFTPLLVIWILICLAASNKQTLTRAIKTLIISAVIAVGISAFFIFPVIYEQQYVHIETLVIGYFNFLAHFVDINQLFVSRFWGYGASVFGPNDGMAFQIGIVHWLVGLISMLTIISWREKSRDRIIVVIFLLVIFLLTSFLTHWKATPFWQIAPKLEYLQFSWRFMSIVMLAISLIAASVVVFFRESRQSLIVAALVGISLIAYVVYFQPISWYNDRTDEIQFSGKLWARQISAGIYDYLPLWSKAPPGVPSSSDAVLATGIPVKASIKKSNSQIYKIENNTSGPITMVVNTLYYPGWLVKINGSTQNARVTDGELGLIKLEVPVGINDIEVKFSETPLRVVSDYLSFASVLGVVGAWLLQQKLAQA